MKDAGESVFERVGEFAKDSRRGAALFFVGRHDEKEAIASCVRIGAKLDPDSNCLVAHGPPGMGKTALAAELVQRMQCAEMHGRSVVCLHLPATVLNAPPLNFVSGLCDSLSQSLAKAPRSALGRLRSQVAKMGGVWLDLKKNWTEHGHVLRASGLTEKSSAHACLNAFSRNMLMSDKVVLALFFDEAQTVEIEPHAKDMVVALYQNLHAGRIVPMFFGLPNTLQVLSQIGVSRLEGDGRVFELGCFEHDEPTELVDKGLGALGIKWGNREWRGFMKKAGFDEASAGQWRKRLVKQVVSESSGFPRHLSAGLTAFCRIVLKHKDAFGPGNDLLDETQAEHEALRISYYKERLNTPVAQAHLSALGALAHMLRDGGGLMRKDAAQLLKVGDEDGDGAPHALADLNALIGKGVLTACGPGGVLIGAPAIPSMTTYLQSLFHEMLKQDFDSARAIAKSYGDPPRHDNVKMANAEQRKQRCRHEAGIAHP